MAKHEDIWRELCDGTGSIHPLYGEKAGLDYLIGEKMHRPLVRAAVGYFLQKQKDSLPRAKSA